mmetsp:Transcript_16285/g.32406  ORF Transcript_16285/g.32406 Transcript_16285/m.32406 type:complete len:316 (-) Transcript_16285:560-1507(-)
MIVLSLWAMVRHVALANSVRMMRWIFISVSTSTDEVASSMTTIVAFRSSARAITRSCRCPTDRFAPPSSTASARARTAYCCGPPSSVPAARPTLRRTPHRAPSAWIEKGSILDRTVPENRVGSCGITAILDRSRRSPRSPMSTPSMATDPVSSSTRRSSPTSSVLFPAPVLPTTPTLARPGIVSRSPRSTSGSPDRYRRVTPSNRISPFPGQSWARAAASAGVSRAASDSSAVYCPMRSTATMFASSSEAIRTDQLRDWVTWRAKETARPARAAKAGSAPAALRVRTAQRTAKKMTEAPVISSRTPSQHCALKVR